jgi:hypothetical protein
MKHMRFLESEINRKAAEKVSWKAAEVRRALVQVDPVSKGIDHMSTIEEKPTPFESLPTTQHSGRQLYSGLRIETTRPPPTPVGTPMSDLAVRRKHLVYPQSSPMVSAKKPVVAPPAQPKAEVAPPAQPKAEVAPPAQPKAEVAPPAQPKAEVAPPANLKSRTLTFSSSLANGPLPPLPKSRQPLTVNAQHYPESPSIVIHSKSPPLANVSSQYADPSISPLNCDQSWYSHQGHQEIKK